MSTEVFGIILGAYGSGSKWALFGGIREAAQVVGYEVPRAISVIVPLIVTGTMNLTHVGQQQTGLFWNWYLFNDPFTFCAFWTFFTCATAGCKRAPFDLAEAESELVAGFHTEYSGFRWLIFFMAEYGSMFAISGIAVILFLGGWNLGIFPWELSGKIGILGNVINVLVFIVKGWLLVFVMMWVRWTLPRLRIDQVMITCLRYLLPISCALLVGVSIWQLLTWEFPLVNYCNYLIAALCLVFVIWTILKLMAVSAMTPTQLMPGAWPAGRSTDSSVASRS
jgi:NADH-quinone oxidoreductase subunit H